MMVARHADTDDHTTCSDAGFLEVVDKARTGDRVAFHQLADRFQKQIYQMVYYRTNSRMDAEDITQDVFLQAYKHIRRSKSSAVFRSWLYRIAVNRVRDFYRKKKLKSLLGFVSMDQETFQETEEMVVDPAAEQQLHRRDFWRQIEQMLVSLSRMEREVFLLRFFDQLTLKEMVEALGKNESTIKTHLYRALGKVKDAASRLDVSLEGLS
jgi:RNA polymerase sigma-70 factor (ECF subfamily)